MPDDPRQRPPTVQLAQALQPAPCAPGQDYELLFTALPNGVDGGRLKLSVLVSPRLKPSCDTQLGQYAPTFTDWPATVRNLQFEAVFESAAGLIQSVPQPLWSAATLDSRLWAAIFQPTTFVRRFEFDRGQRTDPARFQPLALRERNLYRSLIKREIYQQIAVASSTKPPTRVEITSQLERAGILQQVPSPRTPGQVEYRLGVENPVIELLTVRQRLMTQELKQAPVMQRGLEGALISPLRTVPLLRDDAQVRAGTNNRFNAMQLDFLEFQAFALRPGIERATELRRRPKPGVTDWQRILDFHQILASLGDYPELMLRLGLRLDFIVQEPRIQGPGSLSMRLKQPLPGGRVLSPKTRYTLGDDFRAEPGPGSEIHNGFLTFGKRDQANLPVFDVVPGDVEGSVAKITNFTQLLLEPVKAGLAPEVPGLPSLRSAGLAVAHSQRDAWLQGLMIRTKQMNATLQQGQPVVLLAEDLVRGLRIDVREVRQIPNGSPQYGPWHSLCERRGAYYLGPNLPPALEH